MPDLSRTVVFVGPSGFGLNKSELEGFCIRPPAKKGDMLLATKTANRIALIDGYFGGELSIWHKEILYALNLGISVYGASSMGALRAAECSMFGMIGIGAIYQDYSSGTRTSDSDVALIHGPAELDYQPLSLALVDAQATLESRAAINLLGKKMCQKLLFSATKLHFSDRTWQEMIRLAGGVGTEAIELMNILARNEVMQKQIDASKLLNVLRSSPFAPTKGNTLDWRFQKTAYFEQLQAVIFMNKGGDQ